MSGLYTLPTMRLPSENLSSENLLEIALVTFTTAGIAAWLEIKGLIAQLHF
ncbi:hypothetical protein HC248_00693 [Polaromonas vacuolata]|uniref:Uncharacterized protein n=1 Tax=Polaromonas vacuolata TaxID=37448 RepID=A0A6H2H738_9BURK|nr:hypothetical protein [Polaromonas vacuolata]QJC55414.1 hypothetical protein HC248_00693 [Polaromonas vacuolata]